MYNWGGAGGDLFRGHFNKFGEDIGLTNNKGQKAFQDQQKSIGDQYNATQGVLGKMSQQGQDYYSAVNSAASPYKNTVNESADRYADLVKSAGADVNSQAKDSKATYTNQVMPRLQDIMEQNKQNAGSAMSLSQAEDPNNAVASGMRGMFNEQAQGIQKEGLADYGVLAALGSQATGNTIGNGMPMTGGQMQALQGANMGQASQAFSQAQKNANNLKLQGIQTGIDQSNNMYQAGQNAINQYGNSVGAYQSGNDRMNALQNAYTMQQRDLNQDVFGTELGKAQSNYNVDSGLAGLNYGIQNQGSLNQLGAINQLYGAQQGIDAAQAQAANAAQQGKLGAIGSIVGLGASLGAGAAGINPAGAVNGGGGAAGAAGGGGGYQGVSPMQGASLGGSLFQGGFGSPAPVAMPQQQGYQPGMYGGYGNMYGQSGAGYR